MIDHVFSDSIGALREALETARLERQNLEESFYTDLLVGNTFWRASYSLPGEGNPPRIHCDLALEWPTWSQTSYRQWCKDGELIEPPEIIVGVVLRVQRLAEEPNPIEILQKLPAQPPRLDGQILEKGGPTIETIYEVDKNNNLRDPEWAIEVSFDGTYELNERILEDGSELDEQFGQLGVWISSALVQLGDLKFKYKPAIRK